MDKQQYDNPIRQQVLSLPDLAAPQMDSCFGPALKQLMSMAEMFDARKVIVTGCGDSYAAAVAMAPVIAAYCDCFGCTAMRAIEFTRFLSRADIGIGEPNSPVVIAISASGGAARVVEILEKANAVGAFSILITNNPESAGAKAAKRVLFVDTPAFPNDSPGLRSYFASMVGELAFACRMGHVRGTLPPTGPASWKAAIAQYVESYRAALPAIDDAMFALAQQWQNFERFDFIGDDVGQASAFFGAAKFVECNGACCDVSDSEDWCHINFFLNEPQTIGTVVMADKRQPSFGRIVETVASAQKLGRPVLVVTNAPAGAFAPGVTVCTLPDTPEGFHWLMPLMDFAPAALLAGYVATLRGEGFFRTSPAADGTLQSAWFNPEIMTIKSSQINVMG